jgi:hypothetical protein
MLDLNFKKFMSDLKEETTSVSSSPTMVLNNSKNYGTKTL